MHRYFLVAFLHPVAVFTYLRKKPYDNKEKYGPKAADLLTLSPCVLFLNLEKTPISSLYWFAAQQQTSTLRQPKNP